MKIREFSEKSLIQSIKAAFASPDKRIILGIGDDAAVLDAFGKTQVLTTDLLIEDVHFLADIHPASLLGRKSLNVNLSDIAAMGCLPRYALLGLGLPRRLTLVWIETFFSGLQEAAAAAGVALIGGDITDAEKITISITVIGEGDRLIERRGAAEGHEVVVSGTLGDAAQGLSLAEQGANPGDDPETDFFLKAFFDPQPQLALGRELGETGIASAMIDVSDGISVDLGHICEASNVGAEVFPDKLPISPFLSSARKDARDLALHGGEDYQLLFTVPQDKISHLDGMQKRYPLTVIGNICKEPGLFTRPRGGNRRPLKAKGYQHFRGRNR